MAKATSQSATTPVNPIVWISLALALLASGGAVWNFIKTPKVVYVETPVLLNQFNEAGVARKVFEEEQQKWDKVLTQYQDSIKAQVETMKKTFDSSTPAAQNQMRQKLSQMQAAFEDYQGRVRMMSQKKESELMQPVLEKANQFMKQWGQEKGYDLILGTMNGGSILYANEKINVTAPLIKDMNAFYARLPQAPPQNVIKK